MTTFPDDAPATEPAIFEGVTMPEPNAALADVDWRLAKTAQRLREYREQGDERSLEIQLGVMNRQLDERLAVTR